MYAIVTGNSDMCTGPKGPRPWALRLRHLPIYPRQDRDLCESWDRDVKSESSSL